VRWTVRDAAGNTSFIDQTVTVTDDESPTINAPSAIAANADGGKCYATIANPGSPAAADNCSYIVTSDAPANNQYPVGNTIVTWTVTDGANHTATAAQTITVSDNQNPAITAPPAVTVSGYCQPVIVALGTPLTTDNCGVQSLEASVSGNVIDPATYLFPGGSSPTVTTVQWKVTDIHGRNATATQVVTVNPAAIAPNAVVSPLYPMGGQEIQTIYLGYSGSAQSETISMNPSGGTAPYSYSWTKSACNNSGSTAGLTNTASIYTHNAASSDICNSNTDNVYAYVCTVTDDHGCVATATKKINVVNPFASNGADIVVCHKVAVRGGSTTQMMTLPASQLSIHLAHGDYLANCAVFTGSKTIPLVAIAEHEEQQVVVYPNPTTGVFTLEISEVRGDDAAVMITDVAGKLIAMKTVAKSGSHVPSLLSFDLSSLSRGMYLVSVKDGQFDYRTKLIVQ
jgi:hypothetical protein